MCGCLWVSVGMSVGMCGCLWECVLCSGRCCSCLEHWSVEVCCLFVCVGDLMHVVFSVCIVTRGAVGARV